MREGIVGVVIELLVQMQSSDLPTGRQKFKTWWIDWFNGFLPADKRRPRPARTEANILIVASTNRAADLDPAPLRQTTASRCSPPMTNCSPGRR